MKAFLAILHARNLEFVRDRSALGWSLIFPVLVLFGFYFMFADEDKPIYKIGIMGTIADLQTFNPMLKDTRYLQFIEFEQQEEAIKKIQRHQIDLLIQPSSNTQYWVNTSSHNAYIVERMLWSSGGKDYIRNTTEGAQVRYIDWFLPGILAVNMMFNCLFGVGYVIVRYRKSGFLKRLKATPVNAVQFLSAQLASRLILIQALTIVVFVGSNLILGFDVKGSYFTLLLVSVFGSISMIAMGLLIAARVRSEELAGGLLNFISWPMMFLSGAWFSLDGSPEIIKQAALLFPLTHIVNAARDVMNDGATLIDIGPSLGMLALVSALMIALGARMFRWQ